mgnify:CR=1 FL=1
MQFDWEFLGSALLERDPRPIVVLDLSRRALRTNSAFLSIAGARDANHLQIADDWLLPSSRGSFLDAWGRALAGERLRVSVGVFHQEMVVELLPLLHAGAVHSVLLAVMAMSPTAPFIPPLGVLYEVGLDATGGPGRLLRAFSSELERVDTTAPCFRALHGRDGPCEWCPLKNMPAEGVKTVLHPQLVGPFKVTLFTARRAREAATISATPIDENIYRKLVQSRIEALSQKAKLNERERKVLAHVLKGRTLNDIAAAEGVNARSVKYHHQNMLRKLGAESRMDLFRLMS